MTTNSDLLARVTAADPMPWDAALPAEVVDALRPAASIMREGPTMTSRTTERAEPEVVSDPGRRWRGLAVAIAVAIVILIAAVPTAILLTRSGDANVDPIAPATESTTTAPPDAEVDALASVSALLDRYYAAYNGGDVDTAIALLSPMMREVNPIMLEYWIGTLGEQVDATCTPVIGDAEGMTCLEVYTDDLHRASGTNANTQMQYFERNGLLFQAHDASHILVPGCQQNRCPGTIIESTGEGPLWSYEAFESDFYVWLESTHPDVAATIGEPAAIGYFRGDADATALVLPYVEDYVPADPVDAAGGGADLAALGTLGAVEGMYDALNSHDADTYEAFFGVPLEDHMAWFWEQGRMWNHDCVETGDGTVTCDIEVADDFYTRAGAVFRHTEVWRLVDGRLFDTVLHAESSGHWAYSDFEADFADWMATAYPDEAAIAFVNYDFVHNGEAAAIARARLGEFLSDSEEYPRDADPTNDYRG